MPSASQSDDRADLLKDFRFRFARLVMNELNHLAHVATRLLHLLLVKCSFIPNGFDLTAHLPPVFVHTLSSHPSKLRDHYKVKIKNTIQEQPCMSI